MVRARSLSLLINSDILLISGGIFGRAEWNRMNRRCTRSLTSDKDDDGDRTSWLCERRDRQKTNDGERETHWRRREKPSLRRLLLGSDRIGSDRIDWDCGIRVKEREIQQQQQQHWRARRTVLPPPTCISIGLQRRQRRCTYTHTHTLTHLNVIHFWK